MATSDHKPLGALTQRIRARVRLRTRVRGLLGIPETAARTRELERRLDQLGERSAFLTKRSDIAKRRIEALERNIEVWRFMTWLERERPVSERLVSVVTATRNRAEALERCIESVLTQAHTMLEHVVVDDGSEDATPDVLARCTDPRLRSFRIEQKGVCAARNYALEQATGSIVTYLDDDNLMDPLWLMAVARTYDHRPETEVLYGARLVDDWEAQVGRGDGRRLPQLRFFLFDRERLERHNIADTNVIAHRRDNPEAWWDPDLRVSHDWDLMIRLTRDTEPYALPAIACVYSTQATRRLNDDTQALVDDRARIIAKHGLGGACARRDPGGAVDAR